MATIIFAAIIFGLMALVIYKKVKQHRSGESSCGCGCSNCSSSKSCHPEK